MEPEKGESTSAPEKTLEVHYLAEKVLLGSPYEGSNPQPIPLPFASKAAFSLNLT